MSKPIPIPAKATSAAEQSDAIVVSFEANWHQHLLAKDFSVVIRKRVPKASSFTWLYFHINSPLSAICARAPILKIFNASPKQAVALAKEINLTPAEISSYLRGDSTIGCYKLGPFQFGKGPVTTTTLATRLAYYPPQSFVILSKQAKGIIDRFAGFPIPKTAQSSKP